jgi:hypothetical protein
VRFEPSTVGRELLGSARRWTHADCPQAAVMMTAVAILAVTLVPDTAP